MAQQQPSSPQQQQLSKAQKRLSQVSTRSSLDRCVEMALSTTSNANHGINSGHYGQIPTSVSYVDPNWEVKGDVRNKELHEARARIAQMNKQLQWNSECTNNWREKWSKVRNERNKAREEVRLIKNNMDMMIKEMQELKKDKTEIEEELEKKKKELCMSLSKVNIMKNGGDNLSNCASSDVQSENDEHNARMKCDNNISERHIMRQRMKDNLLSGDNLCGKHRSLTLQSLNSHSHSLNISTGTDSLNYPLRSHRLARLQLKLEEANKVIELERKEKECVIRSLDRLQLECNSLKFDKRRKPKLLNNNNIITNQNEDQNDENESQNIGDYSSSSSTCNKNIQSNRNPFNRLLELRKELEELGNEIDLEHNEKLTLRRETQKLHEDIRFMEEKLKEESCSSTQSAQYTTSLNDGKIESLENELKDRNKDLAEMKIAHTKLKKVFQEKCCELSNAIKKAEQFETEVKKLRTRVDELKKSLACAENQVETANGNIRTLQRSNQELIEQIEECQVQIHHLSNRMQNSHDFLSNSSLDVDCDVDCDVRSDGTEEI